MLDAELSPQPTALTVSEALYKAASCHQSGRLAEAESLYLAILQAEPSQPDAHHNLGVLAMQTGQTRRGLSHLKAALQLKPNNPQHWISYIKGLIEAGEHRPAQGMIVEGRKHGLTGPAIDSLESQLAGKLDKPLNSKGLESPSPTELEQLQKLFDHGEFQQVEKLARRLTSFFPHHSYPWKSLGVALKMQKRGAEALIPMREAVRLRPQDAEGHSNLSTTLRELGLYVEAESSCRQALLRQPQSAEAYNNLGVILNEQGRFSEAESACRQALTINPMYPGTHVNLGNALKSQGRLREAENSYRRALSVDPNCFEGLCNLTNVLAHQGLIDESASIYRKVLLLRPDDLTIRSDRLFGMHYSLAYGRQEHFSQALEYGQAAAQRATPFDSWDLLPSPERLRVGIVSGDFRNHPVGYFLENILERLDCHQLSLVAFATYAVSDNTTERLRRYFDDWINLSGVDDAHAAKIIHEEKLHLLIDLSGHTEFNRLPVFAWRPAPVQISWLGYFASTGLAEIDYLLADQIGVPEEQKAFYSEKIWYLPETRLCFTPPRDCPEISLLPGLRAGNLTFGSFQTLAKINHDVLALWGKILSALPLSRLRLQSDFLADPGVRKDLMERLSAHGIEPSRVSMYGGMPREQYLAAYSEVDVILDTFPYPGGATTCEALWMGVPTVTLAGDSLLSRQGASLLSAAGLPEWITYTQEAYVARAVSISHNLAELADFRTGLRRKVASSPLFDGAQFAKNFEEALWEIWRQFTLASPKA